MSTLMIEEPPDGVWAAIRDVGEVHRRLAQGAITDVRPEATPDRSLFRNAWWSANSSSTLTTMPNGSLMPRSEGGYGIATRRCRSCQGRALLPRCLDYRVASKRTRGIYRRPCRAIGGYHKKDTGRQCFFRTDRLIRPHVLS